MTDKVKSILVVSFPGTLTEAQIEKARDNIAKSIGVENVAVVVLDQGGQASIFPAQFH